MSQSSTVSRPTLTLAGARAVLQIAEQAAHRLQAPSSIAVVDANGDLLAFAQMDGARPVGGPLAIGKARSAARFQQPTQALEQAINGGRPAAITAGPVEMQGGEPVKVSGVVVGAIGVSGFDKDKDVQVAQEAASKSPP